MLWLNYVSKQAYATKDVDLCAPRTHLPYSTFIIPGKLVLSYASFELREVFQECVPLIKRDRIVILQRFPGEKKLNLFY